MPTAHIVSVELTTPEAAGLAKLVKRINSSHTASFANRHDGGAEQEDMTRAIRRLRVALADAGFDPR